MRKRTSCNLSITILLLTLYFTLPTQHHNFLLHFAVMKDFCSKRQQHHTFDSSPSFFFDFVFHIDYTPTSKFSLIRNFIQKQHCALWQFPTILFLTLHFTLPTQHRNFSLIKEFHSKTTLYTRFAVHHHFYLYSILLTKKILKSFSFFVLDISTILLICYHKLKVVSTFRSP